MILPKVTGLCPHCGKEHTAAVRSILTGKNALLSLPEALKKLGANKVYLLADVNTWPVAGEKTAELLQNSGMACVPCIFSQNRLEPDEHAIEEAKSHYDASCNAVVSVGSGVLNDIGKIVAKDAGVPCAIVGTAPSMDGYASATSSMAIGGVKVSLPSKCPEIIVGDTEILKTAPEPMLKAGLGDMVAKYVSLGEWRIANIITGEYYCPWVADLVREAVKKCAENAVGLLRREDAAIDAVFEGLVLGGVAMAYAGVSRPASGVEHYFSHIWDMRALEFGTNMDLHGIQCAVGTMLSARLYEKLKQQTPNREKALRHAKEFDLNEYYVNLKALLGSAAEPLIELEKTEGKYDTAKHAKRLEIILQNWDTILSVAKEEIPTVAELEALFDAAKLPKTAEEIGMETELLPMTLQATKDIRDKYVLSRLLWDLGMEL